jgi:hypothetical protein
VRMRSAPTYLSAQGPPSSDASHRLNVYKGLVQRSQRLQIFHLTPVQSSCCCIAEEVRVALKAREACE